MTQAWALREQWALWAMCVSAWPAGCRDVRRLKRCCVYACDMYLGI